MRIWVLSVLTIVAAPAQAQTVEELKKQLEQKDAVIEELRARLDDLERKPQPGSSSQQTSPAVDIKPEIRPQETLNPLADEDANRALERILVQRGGLVLPSGAFELVPELSFTHSGSSAVRDKTQTYGSAVSVRAGLPWDVQVQARIPFVVQRTAGFPGQSGIGDLEFGLTKELVRERGDLPSVLVSTQWTVPTGRSTIAATIASPGTRVPAGIGGGFHIVQGGITAVKKDDPLVLVGSLAFAVTFQKRFDGVQVNPGDVVALGLGAILATSPDTSLGLTTNLAYASNLKLNGLVLARTDQLIGTVGIEFAKILSANAVLNLTTEFGVTDDAPDFRFVASVPWRF